MTRLQMEAVRISMGGQTLVEIDEEVSPGEVLAIMGPSGAGKSTLLSYIAGFLDPAFDATGRILINDEDVTRKPAEARRIGLLFQDPLLFPHLSVAGNLMFGLTGRAGRRQRVAEALATMGLAGFADRDTATLSGGQKARVALLRTLLSEPNAMLLDEPFSKLDLSLRTEVRAFVLNRLRSSGLPTIFVTHDGGDAEAADRIVLIGTSCAKRGNPPCE